MDINENLRQLFKTKPTNYELENSNTLLIYFKDVSVKINFKESGCCAGKYYKWSLDCEVNKNNSTEYKTYRDYILIESLKNNKDINLKELMREHSSQECAL